MALCYFLSIDQVLATSNSSSKNVWVHNNQSRDVESFSGINPIILKSAILGLLGNTCATNLMA